MKRCVRCAEQIQTKAMACRFCGSEQPELSDWQAFTSAFEPFGPRKGIGLFPVLALMALGYCVWQGPPAGTSPAQQIVPDDPAQAAKCEKVIANGGRVGLIRKRIRMDSIAVDSRAWAQLSVDAKRGVAAAVACAAHGGRTLAALDGLDGATVRDYNSGKLLAVAGRAGVDIDP